VRRAVPATYSSVGMYGEFSAFTTCQGRHTIQTCEPPRSWLICAQECERVRVVGVYRVREGGEVEEGRDVRLPRVVALLRAVVPASRFAVSGFVPTEAKHTV